MPRYPIRDRKRPGRSGLYRSLLVVGGAVVPSGVVSCTDTGATISDSLARVAIHPRTASDTGATVVGDSIAKSTIFARTTSDTGATVTGDTVASNRRRVFADTGASVTGDTVVSNRRRLLADTGVTSVTTYTFSIATANDDGTGLREAPTWAGIGSGTFTAEETPELWVSKVFTVAPNYIVDNVFLRFDTSSIPDGETVTAANLLLYCITKADSADDWEYAADFYDFGGSPSVAGDWEQASSGDAIASIDPDFVTGSAVNTFPLTGLSGINKSGYTGIRIAPQNTTVPTFTANSLEFAGFEHAQQEPQLQVTAGVSDTIASRPVRSLTDTAATVTDTVASKRVRAVADTAATVADSLASLRSHSLSDTAATVTGDAIVRVQTRFRTLTDTAATVTGDTLVSSRSHSMTDAGATVSGDTVASRRTRPLADTAVTASDSIARTNVFARTASDTGVAAGSAQLASDDFTRADNADLGANWTPNEDAFKIVSNAVQPNSYAFDAAERYTGTWPNNQYAQATLGGFSGITGGGGTGIGVALRCSSVDATFYMVVVNDSTDDNNVTIYRVESGSFSLVHEENIAANWVTNDVLRAEIVGLTITVFRNGVQVVQVTDSGSPIASGNPGVAYSSNLGHGSLLDWQAGSLGATDSLVSNRRRVLADTGATIVDTTSPARFRSCTDTGATISDTLVSARFRALTDTAATVSDTLVSYRSRTVSDTAATVSDTLIRSNLGRGLTDVGLFTFPGTSVLDDFNRANNASLGANWTELGANGMEINTNRLLKSGAVGAAYWNQAKWADVEVFWTLATNTSGAEWLIGKVRIALGSNRNNDHTLLGASSDYSGYYLRVQPSSRGCRIYRADGDNNHIVLAIFQVESVSIGDQFGLRAVGGKITAFQKAGSLPWQVIGSVIDSTYLDQGRLELEPLGTNQTFDDFGGGAAVTTDTVASSRVRSLTDTACTVSDSIVSKRSHSMVDTGATVTGDTVVKNSTLFSVSCTDTGFLAGFPTTGLLDGFNRADENPLSQSGAWDGPIRAGARSDIRLVGNEIARQTTGSTSEAYRTGTSFLDSEAYFAIKALPTDDNAFVDAVARIQSPGSTNADSYAMELERIGAGNYSITAYRVIDAAFTAIQVVATGVAPAVGDKFGLRVTGTGATVTLRCYMDTGTGWRQIGPDVYDTDASRITAAGPNGVSIGGTTSTAWRLDDFGGGAVVTDTVATTRVRQLADTAATVTDSLASRRVRALADRAVYLGKRQYAFDDFNRADNADLGANWTPIPLTPSNSFAIVSNQATNANYSSDAAEVYSGLAFPDDQYSECTVDTLHGAAGGGAGIGPVVRGSTSAATYYRLVVNSNTSAFWELSKFVAGSYTSIATGTDPFVDGDVVRLEAEGTTLRVYRNGSLLRTVTDSSIASGAPGIGFGIFAFGEIVDNWSGGALVTDSAAVRAGRTLTDTAATVSDALAARSARSIVDQGVSVGVGLATPTVVGTAFVNAWTAENGNGTIDVPYDATAVVAFWSHWDNDGGTTLIELKLEGEDFTFAAQTTEGVPTGLNAGGLAYILDTPFLGVTRTVHWNWSGGGARAVGGGIQFVFLKDVGAVRDFGVDSQLSSTNVSVTLDTEPTDMVIAYGEAFGDDPLLDGTPIANGIASGHSWRTNQIAAGAGSTTVQQGFESYSTMAAISFEAGTTHTVALPIASGSDDGSGWWQDTFPYTWPPAESWVDDSGQDVLYVARGNTGGTEYIYANNAFFRWDTSSIPDTAAIVSAHLVFYPHHRSTSGSYDLVGDYHDFGGEPSVAADGNVAISPSIFTSFGAGFITPGVSVDCELNDLSGINPSGYTGIRLGFVGDTPATGQDNSVQITAYEHASEPVAVLVVTVSVGVSDTVVPLKTSSPAVTDTGATVTDTLVSARSRSASDTGATVTGDSISVSRVFNRVASDTGTTVVGDTIAASRVFKRTTSDTAATVTDSLASLRNRSLSDTAATVVGDSIAKAKLLTRVASDTGATVTDSLVSLRNRALTDTGTVLDDLISTAGATARSVTDTAVTPGDSIERTAVLTRTTSDTGATVSDSTAISRLRERTLSDTGATVTDSLALRVVRTLSDQGATIVDTQAPAQFRSITDTGVAFSETLASSRSRSASDTALALGDSITRTAVFPRAAADTAATVSDSLVTSRSRSLADAAATVSDSIARTATHPRSTTDTGTVLDDLISTAGATARSVTDTAVTPGDSIARTAVFARTTSDQGATLTDSIAISRLRELTLSDTGTTVSDSIAIVRVRSQEAADTGVTISDALALRVVRALSDQGATIVDTTSGASFRSVTDTAVVLTETLASSRSRSATDTAATITDTLAPRVVRVLSDTGATIADAIATAGGIAVADTALTLTDSIARTAFFARATTDTIAISDSPSRTASFSRTASDTAATVSDSISVTRVFERSASDTAATVSDTVASNRVRALTDTALTSTDTLARTLVVRVLTDTGSTIDDAISTAGATARSATDTAVTLTDSITRTAVLTRTTSDTGATVSDSIASLRNRQFTDTAATVSDTVVSLRARTLSDTGATVVDTPLAGRFRSIADTGTSISDALASRRSRLFADTITISDSTARVVARPRSLTDTAATVSDSLVSRQSRSASDTGATVSDSIARTAVHQRVVSDTGTTTTDTLARSIVARSLTDQGATVSDTTRIAVSRWSMADTAATVTDALDSTSGLRMSDTGVVFNDILFRHLDAFRSASDTIVLTDQIASSTRQSEELTDTGASVSDSLTSTPNRGLADQGATLTDSIARSLQAFRQPSDIALTLTDLITGTVITTPVDTAVAMSDAIQVTRVGRFMTDTGASFAVADYIIFQAGTVLRQIIDTGLTLTDFIQGGANPTLYGPVAIFVADPFTEAIVEDPAVDADPVHDLIGVA